MAAAVTMSRLPEPVREHLATGAALAWLVVAPDGQLSSRTDHALADAYAARCGGTVWPLGLLAGKTFPPDPDKQPKEGL